MARKRQLSEMGKLLTAILPTCISQVNYPIHKGLPNPMHGKFFFQGSIPAACYNAEYDNGPFSPKGKSRFYDTEQDAIDAALAAGVTRLQGVDCRKIIWE